MRKSRISDIKVTVKCFQCPMPETPYHLKKLKILLVRTPCSNRFSPTSPPPSPRLNFRYRHKLLHDKKIQHRQDWTLVCKANKSIQNITRHEKTLMIGSDKNRQKKTKRDKKKRNGNSICIFLIDMPRVLLFACSCSAQVFPAVSYTTLFNHDF